MDVIISEDVKSEFPELHLAHIELRGLKIGTSSDRNSRALEEISNRLKESLDIDRVKERFDFRAYRDFFWQIGVDPTKIRPAAEALVRRILRGSAFPRINDFVDAYNIASIETGVPIGAFDLDVLEETAMLRFSQLGEEFLGIGMSDPRILDEKQLVISSGDDLVAIYPYRDAEASKITLDTRDALIISCGVPGIAREQLLEGAERSRDHIITVCGGYSSRIKVV